MSGIDGLLDGIMGQLLGTVGFGSIIALAIVTFLRSRPEIIKIRTEGEAGIRDDLRERLRIIEERADKLQERMDEMREAHKRELEAVRKQHAAEMQVMRHRLNNETQALDTLLMLIRTNPNKLQENISLIEEQRAKQRQEIAAEKGAMRRTDDEP